MVESRLAGAIAVPLLVAGCVAYTPQQLGALSAVELCELEVVQGRNMAAESQRALRAEIERRRVDCRDHRAAIKARHDRELYDLTYGNQSP